jgi:hypothetical protein
MRKMREAHFSLTTAWIHGAARPHERLAQEGAQIPNPLIERISIVEGCYSKAYHAGAQSARLTFGAIR